MCEYRYACLYCKQNVATSFVTRCNIPNCRNVEVVKSPGSNQEDNELRELTLEMLCRACRSLKADGHSDTTQTTINDSPGNHYSSYERPSLASHRETRSKPSRLHTDVVNPAEKLGNPSAGSPVSPHTMYNTSVPYSPTGSALGMTYPSCQVVTRAGPVMDSLSNPPSIPHSIGNFLNSKTKLLAWLFKF
ncbi:hypothetical protein M422DRAFT_27562 [Sphaerobolus stellatus SS14]|nr:hypothetical protein M422DRAFT_27562 [Sphaerobolus stellatus SS14]